MAFRCVAGWLMLFGVVVGVGETSDTRMLIAAGAPSPSAFLNLRLTVSDGLPHLTTRGLMAETETIWRQGHVRLRWLTGSAEPGPGATLRVLVTPRAVAAVGEGPRWPVGELLRFEDTSAIAVASIIGAQRIVEESRRYRLLDLPALHEHRLGVVLGRAVAHEIGHFVLMTNTHASHGLMRASIDAREFADLRAGTFHLDEAAQAHLAAVAAQRASSPESPEPFSYPLH
jgi:hypothetical protein